MRVALAAATGLVIGFGCSVNLNDGIEYTCVVDADCGGDGFKCNNVAGGKGTCCKPTGKELCNGKDDDCNGLIDDGFPAEICNGLDDDCDQKIDEDFDLLRDNANCGRCGNACGSTQYCVNGSCVLRQEVDCNDGLDNDHNGKTDCADPGCNLAPCGLGCRCQALRRAELNCTDGLDNDGDGLTDCEDENCAGAGCGDGGCVCGMGTRQETDCADGHDNDDDTHVDCADTDCVGRTCQLAPSTFRCGATGQCLCNDAGVVTEDATRCADGIDNDCNGKKDCAEPACDQRSCNPDGGGGCLCANNIAKETNCADRKDNDGDGSTDCGDDLDCPSGTPCTYLSSSGAVTTGACGADKICR